MPTPLQHERRINPIGTLRGLVMVMALVIFAVGSHMPAAAATAGATSADADTVKPHKVKKKKVVKPKAVQGSGESTAERDRRLYRECQGRPNAGACEGYAR